MSDRIDADPERKIIRINDAVLGKNEELAQQNRARFVANNITVVNVLSSPGSGKTSLLARTLRELKDEIKMAVIVGDLETDNDAARLRGNGAPVLQIVTGGICHLDASMVTRALDAMPMDGIQLLFIENVGNLVCPSSYDLGEAKRVALLSVTEGEDKPLKYPTLFNKIDAAVITKIDIAEIVEFNREAAIDSIKKTAPKAEIIECSPKTGFGMTAWYDYVRKLIAR